MYKNNSPNNSVSKSLTGAVTFDNVQLKQDTNVVDPVFILHKKIDDIAKYNYLTCDGLGRSYFIRDIKACLGGCIEVYCHVDVLSSWKTELLGNKAIVKRQANDFSKYLNDGSFKTYQNPFITTKAFPSGFSTYEFVLSVSGK